MSWMVAFILFLGHSCLEFVLVQEGFTVSVPAVFLKHLLLVSLVSRMEIVI